MAKEGKEKTIVGRAYNIDDLVRFTIYIYIFLDIRIELQRNRHTIDADHHLSFSATFLPTAFQSASHDDTSYFVCMCQRLASFDATIDDIRHYIERVLSIRVIYFLSLYIKCPAEKKNSIRRTNIEMTYQLLIVIVLLSEHDR